MRTIKRRSQTGEEQFHEAFSASFREQHPNPDRIGCVDKAILWKLAARPAAFRRDPRADATLKHLGECAPCKSELGALHRKAIFWRRVWIVAGACAVGVLALAIVAFFRS